MVSLDFIRTIVGFGLKTFGIGWSLADKFICDLICNGQCGVLQNSNCSLLLLFVGIIFIVSGYALIVSRERKHIGLKKRVTKAVKIKPGS
jgi:hypothetical protein